MTNPDSDFIARCKQGDSAAAEELVDLYWNRVYGFAYRLTHNKSDAEDIAQETFLRAFRNLPRYKPDGAFKAWLFSIETNLFLDQQKSAQARDVPTGPLPQFAQNSPSPACRVTRVARAGRKNRVTVQIFCIGRKDSV